MAHASVINPLSWFVALSNDLPVPHFTPVYFVAKFLDCWFSMERTICLKAVYGIGS